MVGNALPFSDPPPSAARLPRRRRRRWRRLQALDQRRELPGLLLLLLLLPLPLLSQLALWQIHRGGARGRRESGGADRYAPPLPEAPAPPWGAGGGGGEYCGPEEGEYCGDEGE